MKGTYIEKLNDKWFRLVGIPISVIVVLLAQMPFYFPGRWDLFWRYSFINIIFIGLMWEIARRVVLQVRYRFPGLTQTKHRIAWQFWIFFVQIGVGQWLLTKMMLGFGWTETDEPFLKVWLVNFGSSLFFIILIVGIYEAIYFFGQYKTTLQKAESLKKQQAQQRLDALKTRVNPHFLFNSLTTLSALIGEDAPKAERFVDELSKVYRYLLRAGRHPVVTLGEELQFAESYAFLLKNRFEDGAFEVKTKSVGDFPKGASKSPPDLPKELDQHLPILTLQNALDYLVRTQNLPLKIEVILLENHLEITCANQPKTLAFDASDNDWRQLEANGARLETVAGQLKIFFPFTQSTLAT
jgi:Histidine kinase